MTIFYAVIARGTHVLSEYTSEGGNFPSITRVVLAKLPSEDDKRSYVYNKYVFRAEGVQFFVLFPSVSSCICFCTHTRLHLFTKFTFCLSCLMQCYRHVFHYIIENGITYLCLCDNEAERRIPFMFLEDIKEQFKNQYGERIHTAIAFAMNDFSRVIHERMVCARHNGERKRDPQV